MDKSEGAFEEIFEQNKRRIHYYIHRLNIQDPHQEYYQEGLVAMWNAYEKYDPDKGPMATYFNYTIRNRMIDLMRKQNQESAKVERFAHEHRTQIEDGNYHRSRGSSYPIAKKDDSIPAFGAEIWNKVRRELSDNQWKWVMGAVVEGLKAREIAEREGVTVEAVKSWAKTAKEKLRKIDACGHPAKLV